MLIIGNPQNRRVTAFQDAWTHVSGMDAKVLAWRDLLKMPPPPERWMEGVDALRIESPGEDAEVERLILEHGARDAHGEREWLAAEALGNTDWDPSRIRLQQQWFLGWSKVLRKLGDVVLHTGVRVTGDPKAIRHLFDKSMCHQICRRRAIPMPELIGVSPAGFDELMEMMDRAGCHRVFLKPRHGSSASGVVALRQRGTVVIGTAAIERQGDVFHNSLRVRDYRIGDGLREVVECVCRQDAIVERWFPKCGFEGFTVDLRVVTIGGEPTHWVLRSSRGPMTNLHLGNRRGDLATFREAMGSHWEESMEVCRRTAAAFPGMLTLGIDLMVSPSHRRFAVAEVNAFGDLLPGVVDDQGRSTYERQAVELLSGTP